jgi:hypothetical protein
MAEQSGFFNAMNQSGIYDRVYDSSDFANYFSKFISDGVFINPTNQLKVVESEGLTVTIRKGSAFIEGYWYTLDEDMNMTISPNPTGYETQVKICCTLNRSERKISVTKEESATNLKPVNDEVKHELVLATISLGVSASTITDSVITDRRPDDSYCGFVKGVVEQIETEELFLQFSDSFEEWFDTVKGQLSGDIAGKLQQQINGLAGDASQLSKQIIDVKEWKVLKGLQDKTNYGFPNVKTLHHANAVLYNKEMNAFNFFIQILSEASSPMNKPIGAYKILNLKKLVTSTMSDVSNISYSHELTKLQDSSGNPTGDDCIAIGFCIGTCTKNEQYPVYVGRATQFDLYYNVVDGYLYCFIPDPNWWGTSVIINITGTFIF